MPAMTANETPTLHLLAYADHPHDGDGDPRVVQLANDADPQALQDSLDGVERIDLHFPKFTDGRAYSQAYLLRRRLRFTGDIRATGDVLIDQLVHMTRTGFTSAVLKEGVDAADARRQFERFAAFYQGDITHLPHVRAAEDGNRDVVPAALSVEESA
jgi:uncharacterized protein (DUF934 family)